MGKNGKFHVFCRRLTRARLDNILLRMFILIWTIHHFVKYTTPVKLNYAICQTYSTYYEENTWRSTHSSNHVDSSTYCPELQAGQQVNSRV